MSLEKNKTLLICLRATYDLNIMLQWSFLRIRRRRQSAREWPVVVMTSFYNVTRLVVLEKEKQVRLREKNTKKGEAYVDKARNIAVVLESKDLAEDFEKEKLGYKIDGSAPNTKVREHQYNIFIIHHINTYNPYA